MPRGSDFTARWSEGAWAEIKIIEAINDFPPFLAVPFGISDGEAFRSIRAMEARELPNQLRHGKRPDVLVFDRSKLSAEEVEATHKVYELDDDDCENIVRKARLAIEGEFSPYQYAHRMREYGKGLSFTIKEEDLQPTLDWRDHYRVEVGIAQVFYDEAYLIFLQNLESGIADGSIKRKMESSYNKPVYYPPMKRGLIFGTFVENPKISADLLLDKYGKLTPFRKTEGGRIAISEALKRILNGSSNSTVLAD